MYVFDIPYLLNNGLMDPLFPYPMAFCTMFNMGFMLICLFLAFLLINIIIIVYRVLCNMLNY